MKKLKIFLLLSILLCFGFALSFEVHAEGDGPKVFEVNDVLPATTQLRISWGDMEGFLSYPNHNYCGNLKSNNNSFVFFTYADRKYKLCGIGYFYDDIDDPYFISPYTDKYGDHPYMDIDTSNWSLEKRTISSYENTYDSGTYNLTWEDLAPAPSVYSITFEENGGTSVTDLSEQTALPNPLPTTTKSGYTFLGWYYDSDFTNQAFAGDPLTGDVTLYAKWGSGKVFEVTDVLPQGIIRISWDETEWFRMAYVLGDPGGNQILSSNNSFDLLDYIYPQVLTYPEPGYLEFIPPYTVYGGGHAYIDIDTSEWDLSKRTISTVFWREGLTSRLYWEDITPDGYTQGYQAAMEYYGWEDDGHWYTGEEAWDMGNEYARERYGYYDPITHEWLSVSEYLDRYGTDKMDQSDFYNNFDKYFIPAMIIVFGAAIVLTLLKVFKGRE